MKIFATTACILIAATPAMADPQKMSKTELQKVLIGNTYPLGGKTIKASQGALFFQDEKTVVELWKGKSATVTWKALKDGSFCYSSKLFGAEECITLLKEPNGGYVHVYQGQSRALPEGAIEKGNHLSKVKG